MESVRPVSKLSTESVGSRRELVANCVHTADADATKLYRRCVLGITHCRNKTEVLKSERGSIHKNYAADNLKEAFSRCISCLKQTSDSAWIVEQHFNF